ncbi:MAG: hypothetical protein ACKOOF_10940 [Planctomycetaceae bacterium]
MVLESVMALAMLLAMGIEAAYVPSDDGGGDYLVRVEPDLVRGSRGDSPYQFTSDVPDDASDVRRVRIYVADNWPRDVERSVIEAAKRPRKALPVAATTARSDIATPTVTTPDRPWGWLIGSLIALFLSLGANAYLGMLLGAMRQRYLRDIQQGYVKA